MKQIVIAVLVAFPAMAVAQLGNTGQVGGTVGTGLPGGRLGGGTPGGSIAGTASAGVGGAVNSAVNGTRTITQGSMAPGAPGTGLRVDNRGYQVRPGASVGADAGGATSAPVTGAGADVGASTGLTNSPSAPPPR